MVVLKQVLSALLPRGHPAVQQAAAAAAAAGSGGAMGNSSSSGPNKAAIISSIQVRKGDRVWHSTKCVAAQDAEAANPTSQHHSVKAVRHHHQSFIMRPVLHHAAYSLNHGVASGVPACLLAFCRLPAGQCQPCSVARRHICQCRAVCGCHASCCRHLCATAAVVLCVTRTRPQHVSQQVCLPS